MKHIAHFIPLLIIAFICVSVVGAEVFNGHSVPSPISSSISPGLHSAPVVPQGGYISPAPPPQASIYRVISPSSSAIVTTNRCTECNESDNTADIQIAERSQYLSVNEEDAEISRINKYIKDNRLDWKAGKTSISNLTPESFQKMLGYKPPESVPPDKQSPEPEMMIASLPDSFSWRSNNGDWTTPVKNQGQCGSCWAFAGTSVFESFWERITNDPNLNPDFAEQYLMDCTNLGDCNGGWIPFDAFISHPGTDGKIGTPSESSLPYQAYKRPSCTLSYSAERYRAPSGSGWSYIGTYGTIPNENTLKNYIYNYGPIWATFIVDNNFRTYTGGYFSGSATGNTNHAITIVGWGIVPAGYNNAGKTYWICKNSWGTWWGESGYFNIVAGSNKIGQYAAYMYGVPVPVPTVTSISPASGIKGQQVNITNLQGTNFETGAQVELRRTGYPSIKATNEVVASSTSMTCTIDLTNAVEGTYDIAVTNPGGIAGTGSQLFTVIDLHIPTVTSISPASGFVGSSVSTTISGTDFVNPMNVSLWSSSSPKIITGNPVTVSSTTRMSSTFSIPYDTWTGSWNIRVSNPNGETDRHNMFTISPLSAPKLTSITPSSGTVGNTVTVKISGSNLQTGAEVWLGTSGNLTEIPGRVLSQTKTYIQADFSLPWSVPGGLRDVTIKNPDGQTSTLQKKFNLIGASDPVVTKITPPSGIIGNTVPFTLTGTNFINGLRINLIRSGQDPLSAQNIRVSRATSASGQFVLPLLNSSEQGAWDLVTSYPSGNSSTFTGGFTISPLPAPKLTSITPSKGMAGKTVTTTIVGSNFKFPVEVMIWSDSEIGLPGINTVLTGTKTIRTQLAIPANMEKGKKNLTVTNPDGQVSTLSNAFTVL